MASGTVDFEAGTVGNDVTSLFNAAYLDPTSTFKVATGGLHSGSKMGQNVRIASHYAESVLQFGSLINTVYSSYYFYIVSGYTRTTKTQVGSFTNNSGQRKGIVGVDFTSGTKLYIGFVTGGTTYTGTVNLPTDQWIRIDHSKVSGSDDIVRAYTGLNLESANTADAYDSVSFTSTPSDSCDRYYYGGEESGTGDVTTNYDGIAWDTASLPAPRGSVTPTVTYRTGGVWVEAAVKVRVAGVWTTPTAVRARVGGVWVDAL